MYEPRECQYGTDILMEWEMSAISALHGARHQTLTSMIYLLIISKSSMEIICCHQSRRWWNITWVISLMPFKKLGACSLYGILPLESFIWRWSYASDLNVAFLFGSDRHYCFDGCSFIFQFKIIACWLIRWGRWYFCQNHIASLKGSTPPHNAS